MMNWADAHFPVGDAFERLITLVPLSACADGMQIRSAGSVRREWQDELKLDVYRTQAFDSVGEMGISRPKKKQCPPARALLL